MISLKLFYDSVTRAHVSELIHVNTAELKKDGEWFFQVSIKLATW